MNSMSKGKKENTEKQKTPTVLLTFQFSLSNLKIIILSNKTQNLKLETKTHTFKATH